MNILFIHDSEDYVDILPSLPQKDLIPIIFENVENLFALLKAKNCFSNHVYIAGKVVCKWFCFLDVNECLSNPCHEKAVCSNLGGSFTCRCYHTYTGNGITCLGIQIVLELFLIPRIVFVVCVSDFNLLQLCYSHYSIILSFPFDVFLFIFCVITDVDECSSRTHGCDSNAFCVNFEGSYKCSCYIGYEGDGKNNCQGKSKN